MEKRFIALFVLAFIFSFNLSVMADEGHGDSVKQATEKFKEGTNEQEGHSEETATHSDAGKAHDEEEDVHGEKEGAHEDGAEAHEGGARGDDHHGPVVETPPNYKVLGTYGAVNLSFILIGVWNKWFRRKGIK